MLSQVELAQVQKEIRRLGETPLPLTPARDSPQCCLGNGKWGNVSVVNNPSCELLPPSLLLTPTHNNAPKSWLNTIRSVWRLFITEIFKISAYSVARTVQGLVPEGAWLGGTLTPPGLFEVITLDSTYIVPRWV